MSHQDHKLGEFLIVSTAHRGLALEAEARGNDIVGDERNIWERHQRWQVEKQQERHEQHLIVTLKNEGTNKFMKADGNSLVNDQQSTKFQLVRQQRGEIVIGYMLLTHSSQGGVQKRAITLRGKRTSLEQPKENDEEQIFQLQEAPRIGRDREDED